MTDRVNAFKKARPAHSEHGRKEAGGEGKPAQEECPEERCSQCSDSEGSHHR